MKTNRVLPHPVWWTVTTETPQNFPCRDTTAENEIRATHWASDAGKRQGFNKIYEARPQSNTVSTCHPVTRSPRNVSFRPNKRKLENFPQWEARTTLLCGYPIPNGQPWKHTYIIQTEQSSVYVFRNVCVYVYACICMYVLCMYVTTTNERRGHDHEFER